MSGQQAATRRVCWDDVARRRTESREFTVVEAKSHDRVVVLRCPFCDARVDAHRWSLAGSGKRCTCGALFGSLLEKRAHRLLERFQ